MKAQNKHHHRKTKSNNSAGPASQDSELRESSERSTAAIGVTNTRQAGPANDSSGNNSAGNDDDSKLHFADATLQTPEEHATDEKINPSTGDKTTANS